MRGEPSGLSVDNLDAGRSGVAGLDLAPLQLGSDTDAVRQLDGRTRGHPILRAQRFTLRPRYRTTWFGLLTVALLLIVDSGVPFLLMHAGDFVVGRMTSAALIVFTICFPSMAGNKNFGIGGFIPLAPALLMALMIVISFVSNLLIFSFGLANFAPSLYTLFPVLTFYALRKLNISTGDIIWGFVVSALFAAVIVIIDSISRIDSLIEMRRMSVFDSYGNTNRLVILKDACTIALVMLIANLMSRNKAMWRYLLYAMCFALISYPVFVTFESRFAIIVTLLATAIFLISARISAKRRVWLYSLGLLIGLPCAWLALDKFIAPLLSGDFATYAKTNNVSVRIDSLNYYTGWFLQSYGIGIGHMSTSPNYKNILSTVVDRSFNLNDLGLYAALFQFGIIGLIFSFFMTGYMIFIFFRFGYSTHPRAAELHIMGAYVLASLIQVIPTNFFTLGYSCIYGSILWYMMCRAQWEQREAERLSEPDVRLG